MASYIKQTWNNGMAGSTPISAQRLSHIEDGIEAAALASTTVGGGVSRVNEGPLSFLDPRVGGLMDGSDETSKFNTTAVNLLPADGGEIYIPPGILKANINLQRDGVTVSGAGLGTILRAVSGDTVVTIGDDITTRLDNTFRDLTIDGESTLGRTGMKTLQAARLNLYDVNFKRTPYAGLWLGGSIGTTQVYGFGCRFQTIGSGGTGTTGWGILAEDNTNACEFYGCDWLGCVQGAVRATNCYHFKVHGTIQACGIGGTEPYGVHFLGGAGIDIDCYFEATAYGAPIAGSADIFLEKNGLSYLESAVVRGYIFGSGVCEYGVKMDGVRNVQVESGATVYGHAVSEFYATANVASEGIHVGKVRMPSPVVDNKSGPGASAISIQVTGESEYIPYKVIHQKAVSDNKTTTAYTVGGNALALDVSTGNIQKVTLSASMGGAVTTFTNATDGQTFTVIFIQDATGSRTYNWPAACKFAGNTAPVASTAAGAKDSVTFWYDGANGHFNEKSRSIGMP